MEPHPNEPQKRLQDGSEAVQSAALTDYGTRSWIDARYAACADDPWGLDWRLSQQYRYARMLAALQSRLAGVARPLAMIDVGCATGAFTAMLGRLDPGPGASLLGTDIAAAAIARAAARYPHIAFACMSLDDCARQHGAGADLVTCMEVLYYLPAEQRRSALLSLKSMLKPGGFLLVSSMIAAPPYFSLDALGSLVASELAIVDTGVLYLKPLAAWEKLQMKMKMKMQLGRTGAPRASAQACATLERWSAYAERWCPTLTRSHAYVIAHAA